MTSARWRAHAQPRRGAEQLRRSPARDGTSREPKPCRRRGLPLPRDKAVRRGGAIRRQRRAVVDEGVGRHPSSRRRPRLVRALGGEPHETREVQRTSAARTGQGQARISPARIATRNSPSARARSPGRAQASDRHKRGARSRPPRRVSGASALERTGAAPSRPRPRPAPRPQPESGAERWAKPCRGDRGEEDGGG